MAKKDFNKETLDKVHDWAFQDVNNKMYYFHVSTREARKFLETQNNNDPK